MNTKTYLLLLSKFTLLTVLAGCGICSDKKIDCPGFKSDVLDTWFSYKDNQRLVFLSSTNQRDSFTLRNLFTSAPYVATSNWESQPRCAVGHKEFKTLETDTAGRSRLSIFMLDESPEIVFTINRLSFKFQRLGEDGLVQGSPLDKPFLQQLRPTVTLGNRTFNNTVENTFDTTKEKGIGVYKVYYAKNEGLVAYTEYPSLKTWVKQ